MIYFPFFEPTSRNPRRRAGVWSVQSFRFSPTRVTGIENRERTLAVGAFAFGNTDAGDAGEGLGKSFGRTGKRGERGQGAQFGQQRGCVAGPGGVRAQERIEGIAQGIGADPHRIRIVDGFSDSAGIESEYGSGGCGPSGAIGKAGDVAEIDVADAKERGRN